MHSEKVRNNNIVLYISSYPPRECGIATFTQDLVSAIDKRFNPTAKSRIIALNENPTTLYRYDSKAIDSIAADSLQEYVTLAEKINKREEVKLVNIQHEFGLFGGSWGDYLVPFLQVIKKPVAVTFHSVLPNPDEQLRNLVQFICGKAKAVVVMNEFSRDILKNEYQIPKSKITLIPHGIPQTTFEPSAAYKAQLGLDGKTVLSTFGLLSGGKGIEYAIRALPPLVKEFPNLAYLVIGATHPVVRKEEGELYRNFLTAEVGRLGLNNVVKFYNKYLSVEEIITYLKATDIYVSPSLGESQSVSGTLSYALGCGRPVVSTRTSYAQYLISEKNGTLVDFRNPHAITRALQELLTDEKYMKVMAGEAYETTRKMIWPNVAAAYFNVYKKIADIGVEEKKLPEIKFDHVRRLTDDFGILHHARYSKPQKRYGYSLDDNAKALIVSAKYYEIHPNPTLLELMSAYLNFMKFSQKKNGSFSRLVNMQKKRDTVYDEDVLGKGMWALGYFLSRDFPSRKMRRLAETMFRKALAATARLRSPRAIAFAMTGLYYYLKRFPKKRIMNIFTALANRQLSFYKDSATKDWRWFEDRLTYSNSKLPESLLYAYELTKDKRYLDVAEKTLGFLRGITFEKGSYAPIGQAGWYVQHRARSYFDQQPEDTASMVETKALAYKLTGDLRHAIDAYKAFQWFVGRNHLNLMVYDEVTGGCHDGLGRDALNLNQGAESTISYLLARLAIEEIRDALA